MIQEDNPNYSFGFYNLENLFDPDEKDHTLDKDYTPEGIYAWNLDKYQNKIDNLGLAISKIGTEHSKFPPLIMGVCEVENRRCLEDLAKSKCLHEFNYDFVHFESPDRRGLDTALLFQKNFFTVIDSKPYTIDLVSVSGKENTRDILYVKGTLMSETLHILVNHWPSRLDGHKATQSKRDCTASKLKQIVDDNYKRDSNSKILILGDFNDDPGDLSLTVKFGHNFFNPFIEQNTKQLGSAKYRGKWVQFDQILLNKNLLETPDFVYKKSVVFSPEFLIQKNGRHKGSPKRSYIGHYHLGGFSDHFPVYSLFQFISEENP